ncbi:unnamed protein product [Pleuronectes platessa]|uniref:Uncharacterized protein n=1 Tax=Pleuronectes platessa TaxID=8262 RepID=A0A9N7TY31_PLEPL|nr:unnamed protein product [Pleuronectes platessa]
MAVHRFITCVSLDVVSPVRDQRPEPTTGTWLLVDFSQEPTPLPCHRPGPTCHSWGFPSFGALSPNRVEFPPLPGAALSVGLDLVSTRGSSEHPALQPHLNPFLSFLLLRSQGRLALLFSLCCSHDGVRQLLSPEDHTSLCCSLLLHRRSPGASDVSPEGDGVDRHEGRTREESEQEGDG